MEPRKHFSPLADDTIKYYYFMATLIPVAFTYITKELDPSPLGVNVFTFQLGALGMLGYTFLTCTGVIQCLISIKGFETNFEISQNMRNTGMMSSQLDHVGHAIKILHKMTDKFHWSLYASMALLFISLIVEGYSAPLDPPA